jgi:hypothetical protein
VRTDDGEQIVLLEESASGRIREEVRASSDVVVNKEVVGFLLPKLFEWVGPEDIAHQSVCGWLTETINLDKLVKSKQLSTIATYALQIIQSVEFGAQTAVYAQELLVHDCGQRQCAERVHASLVYGFRVLVLALKLECEVISQMPAFVVSAKQPERVGVPDLE